MIHSVTHFSSVRGKHLKAIFGTRNINFLKECEMEQFEDVYQELVSQFEVVFKRSLEAQEHKMVAEYANELLDEEIVSCMK